jgi:hypothetical protein
MWDVPLICVTLPQEKESRRNLHEEVIKSEIGAGA